MTGRAVYLWWALLTAVTGRHFYLSTGCLHGDHAYCSARTGKAGAKRPAECKTCSALAPCRCRCHRRGRGRGE